MSQTHVRHLLVTCCDLGTVKGTVLAPPPFRYVDSFGYAYHLCAHHYQALVAGLQKAERFRPRTVTKARPRPRRLLPRSPRQPGDAQATGEEQRRARRQVGWSLRRMEEEVGRSRGQLSAAENGKRPVDPDVARWVRAVLDEPLKESPPA